MKNRYLMPKIDALCFEDHKMAFVGGPRQCGKTTLAKIMLGKRKSGSYFNWDDIDFRRVWTKHPKKVIPGQTKKTPLVVLDEIHKARYWKRTLKGVYDTLKEPSDILVTGSARLNVYKKGGDSLLGRYFYFRLHPFTMGELISRQEFHHDVLREAVFEKALPCRRSGKSCFDDLMIYGGFPEPFLGQDQKKARIWRRSRIEQVIREDLRDLSRIPELSQIEMLASLLPERVGSLFSYASLREDLEVSQDTVKRWMALLQDLYYAFIIKPYTHSVVRSLKKEGKMYLWDYSEIPEKAARFENLIACHLLKVCHYWTDCGEGLFELFYLRNKEKEEIDFLITRQKKPWLPIEVKLTNTEPSLHWRKFLNYIKCPFAIQIVSQHGFWKSHKMGDTTLLVAGASDILPYMV